MLRSLLVAIFPAVMLASGVIANAQTTVAWNGVASSGSWIGPRVYQSSTQQNKSHKNSAASATSTKRASDFGASQHNGAHNGWNRPHHPHHRNANFPWWSRSVYLNAGTVDQYLATPTPKPKAKAKKNNVTQPGVEVFKSIGN
jgi:hypothetical protein